MQSSSSSSSSSLSSSSSTIYNSLARDAIAASESLSAMLAKEQSHYTVKNYLHPPSRSPPAPQPQDEDANHANNNPPPQLTPITEADRLKIVDWCYNVVDQCQFQRDTVSMTMTIVDRFLSIPSAVTDRALYDRKEFQLVAMAALYVAIKTNEPMALGSAFFSATSRGTYSIREIEDMELTVLSGLSWRIHSPSPVQVAHHVLSLVVPFVSLEESQWARLLDEVRFRTEHAVRDYYFALARPSTVAMAAVFDALDGTLEKRDRRAVLHALLLVMNEDEFDGPQALYDGKARMKALVGEGDAAEERAVAAAVAVVAERDYDNDDDDATIVSVSSNESREVEDVCSSPDSSPAKRRAEETTSYDQGEETTTSRKRARKAMCSPDAVVSDFPRGDAP